MMPGNAGALAHGSRMMGAMYDTTGSAAAGLSTAQATLELWQGAGANAALATAVAIQDGLNQAQQSLIAARATMNWYSQEVEQDNLVLMQTDQQETQLKTERAQDEKQLETLKSRLASVQAQLAHAIVANEAARAAASPLTVGGPIFPAGPAPAVHLIDTSGFTAQIDQLNQEISLLQFAIQTLDQKIQACETKKKEYEAKLKQASSKVTSEMQQAISLWPKAGLGSVNIQDATGCIAGYSPPPPNQGGGLLGTLEHIGEGLVVGAAVVGVQFVPGVDVAVDTGLAATAGTAASVAETAAPAVDAATTAWSSLPATVQSFATGSATGFGMSAGTQAIFNGGHVNWGDAAINGLGFGAGGAATEALGGSIAWQYGVGNMTGTAAQSEANGHTPSPSSLALNFAEGYAGGTAESYLLPKGYLGLARQVKTSGFGSAVKYSAAHAAVVGTLKYGRR